MSSGMLGPFERYATRNVMHISDSIAPDVFAKIYERIGEDPSGLWHQVLGKGSTAVATWLKSDKTKVLKITNDESDAYAMEKFLKRPSRHVVKVYDVFQITPFAWGMVVQKVTPLASSAYKDWTRTRSLISKFVGVPPLGNGAVPIYQKDLEKRFEYPSKSQMEPLEKMRAFLKQLALFDEALADRGITWFQDLHAGNVGMNRRDMVLLDLGGVRTSVPSLPKIEVEAA